MNATLHVTTLGQKPVLDNLSRSLLRDGTLAKLIAEDGVSGVTLEPGDLPQRARHRPVLRRRPGASESRRAGCRAPLRSTGHSRTSRQPRPAAAGVRTQQRATTAMSAGGRTALAYDAARTLGKRSGFQLQWKRRNC